MGLFENYDPKPSPRDIPSNQANEIAHRLHEIREQNIDNRMGQNIGDYLRKFDDEQKQPAYDPKVLKELQDKAKEKTDELKKKMEMRNNERNKAIKIKDDGVLRKDPNEIPPIKQSNDISPKRSDPANITMLINKLNHPSPPEAVKPLDDEKSTQDPTTTQILQQIQANPRPSTANDAQRSSEDPSTTQILQQIQGNPRPSTACSSQVSETQRKRTVILKHLNAKMKDQPAAVENKNQPPVVVVTPRRMWFPHIDESALLGEDSEDCYDNTICDVSEIAVDNTPASRSADDGAGRSHWEAEPNLDFAVQTSTTTINATQDSSHTGISSATGSETVTLRPSEMIKSDVRPVVKGDGDKNQNVKKDIHSVKNLNKEQNSEIKENRDVGLDTGVKEGIDLHSGKKGDDLHAAIKKKSDPYPLAKGNEDPLAAATVLSTIEEVPTTELPPSESSKVTKEVTIKAWPLGDVCNPDTFKLKTPTKNILVINNDRICKPKTGEDLEDTLTNYGNDVIKSKNILVINDDEEVKKSKLKVSLESNMSNDDEYEDDEISEVTVQMKKFLEEADAGHTEKIKVSNHRLVRTSVNQSVDNMKIAVDGECHIEPMGVRSSDIFNCLDVSAIRRIRSESDLVYRFRSESSNIDEISTADDDNDDEEASVDDEDFGDESEDKSHELWANIESIRERLEAQLGVDKLVEVMEYMADTEDEYDQDQVGTQLKTWLEGDELLVNEVIKLAVLEQQGRL